MRFLILLLTLAIAPALLAQERIIVKMEPAEGLDPLDLTWAGTGEASDPIGGPFNPLEDSLTGLPIGLTELDVRFLDLQPVEASRMGYLKGNVRKARYDDARRFYGGIRPPDSVLFDQRLDYAVGRDKDGRYAVVFDTDNDEDLSDEVIHQLPWDGPAMSMQEFSDSVMNTPRYADLARSLPRVEIESEVFVDGEVLPLKQTVLIMPFIYNPSPGPSIPDKRLYLISFGSHRSGKLTLDDVTYEIWSHSLEATYEPGSATFRVVESSEITDPGVVGKKPVFRNHGLGDVIRLGDRRFRLDNISPLGDELRLEEVTSRSLIGSGSSAPSIAADLVRGGSFDLADQIGKHVLLHFWSTRCTGCHDEQMPDYYAMLDSACVEFVGVVDGKRERAADMATWRGLQWGQVEDKGGVFAQAYGVSTYPSYVLIDPAGDVLSTEPRFGPTGMFEKLQAAVGPQCVSKPTAEDVSSVFWGDRRYTEPVDYFLEGCRFAASEMAVRTIGDRNAKRGWPVTLDVSGECTSNDDSADGSSWLQELTINVWLFRNRGEWALLAREPFVVSR